MVAVPGDGLRETGDEVRVDGLPTEFAMQLAPVGGVATVMAGPVAHPVEVIGRTAHELEDGMEHIDVGAFAVCADEVRLADTAARQDLPHRAGVILDVNPVAYILAVAVELGAHTVEDVGDLAGDELLHVLEGAVVVGAVGDGGSDAVGAVPGAHEHVRARLRGGVRRTRTIRALLGEARRVAEGKVSVDLVGAHVVEAHAVGAAGLEQAEGPLHVGAQERLRASNGVVVVALRREVHDRVVARDEAIEQFSVANVAHNELDTARRKSLEVLAAAGVGELVEYRHVHARVLVHDIAHEVAADEATATGNDDVGGLERFTHVIPQSQYRIVA